MCSDQIKSRGDGVILFQGMQDHTAETIKSLEGFNRAWIEEAQTLSERSLTLFRPTIRAEGFGNLGELESAPQG
jgi:phage terminase large subunit